MKNISVYHVLGRVQTGFLVLLTVLLSANITGCSRLHHADHSPDMTGYETGLRIHSVLSNPDAAYGFGLYLQRQGKHRLALREFEKAVEADPGHVRARNAMGISHDVLGNFKMAALCYEGALALSPDAAWLHNNMGISAMMQDNPAQAVQSMERAVELEPENSLYHNNLGLAYVRNGEPGTAFIQFAKAQGAAHAHKVMATLYQEQGLSIPAGKHLDMAMALELQPAEKSGPDPQRAFGTPNRVKRNDPEPQTRKGQNSYQEQIEKKNIAALDNVSESSPGVEISNGNGVRNMAARVRNYLEERGVSIVRLTNAQNFSYPDTIIFYRPGYAEHASRISREIPGIQQMRQVDCLERETVKIKILIGQDIVQHDRSVFNIFQLSHLP